VDTHINKWVVLLLFLGPLVIASILYFAGLYFGRTRKNLIIIAGCYVTTTIIATISGGAWYLFSIRRWDQFSYLIMLIILGRIVEIFGFGYGKVFLLLWRKASADLVS